MDTDRNLLFGVLALQADLIDRNQFVEACTAWATRKDVLLAELLIARGWLTSADQADVERLLERKLNKHGHSIRASLATVLNGDVRSCLAAVDDPEIATVVQRQPNIAAESVLIPPIPLSRQRYALMRVHATGGIGRVWLARDEHLGRSVALKELRTEQAENPAHWARFLREARITGQLEHPGIVPVYELAKRPENQQPFYTMRFVQGHTLRAAAASFHQQRKTGRMDPLDLRALLNAFLGVCNALAYSHARGVVHRDLKGDNILLGEFGEVLVLDWGLAKVLGQAEDGASRPLVQVNEDPALQPTLQGQVMGTPAYMAPEQAAGDVDRIDPRTDVYGLGAILYELLTGRPPFDGASFEEILRNVQSAELVRPRQAWAGVPAALEAICLRALAKKPEQRYPSARALAQEVQRWLADEPVTAYLEPWTVKARRWARRHRPAVAAAAALLVTAVIALSISTALIRQREQAAQHAREQAERQRDRADRNLCLAREAVDKTVNKITGNQRLKEADFHQLRHELLESMVPFYEEFVKQQENDVELKAERGLAWFSLAELRQEMGDREGARSDYDQISAIFRRLATDFPTEPEYRKQLARSRNNLAVLLHDEGKSDEAATAYRDALQIRTQLAAGFPSVPQYRRELARSHINLGNLQYELGQPGEAGAAYRDALQILVQLATDFPAVPEYRQDLATSHNGLGVVLLSLGKGDQAETEFRDALRIQTQLATDFPAVPEYRQDLAQGYNNLGVLLRKLDKRDEAEAVYCDALKIQTRLADDFPAVPEYRKDLAQGYNNLGILLRRQGKRDAAQAAYRDALKIQTRLADDFPTVPDYLRDLATSHNNLGNLLDDLGKRGEAESAFCDAMKIQTQLAEKFPAVSDYQNELAVSLVNLARLVQGGKEPARARQLLEQAVPHHRAALKANDRNPTYRISFRTNRQVLAEALLDLGDHTAAADAADQLVQAAVEPTGDVYNAGCFLARCVPLAERDSKLTLSERQERAQAYANRAVAALRHAIQNGFKNVPHMRKDPNLDPLRSKPEFQQLLKELEAQTKPQGE
jgi:serine/threonine-protein kinase